MNMKKSIFFGLALLVIAAFVFAAAFGSCEAIASTTGDALLDEKIVLDAQSAKAANGVRSEFFAVAKDSSGCTYAAGYQYGSEEYSYGTVRVSGSVSDSDNAVIVKYDKNGTALWARSVNAGSKESWFGGVAVDDSGRVYVVGVQGSTGVYNYGNNVTVAGSFDGGNALIVQYDSNGTAQWAKSVTGGGKQSRFSCVAANSSGVYVGGKQTGSGTFNYGAGVSVAGSSDDDDDDESGNAVLVKYNSSGNALWAKSVAGAGEGSIFYGVSADGSGKVYAVGSQRGDVAYDYGNSITATGGGHSVSNAVIVQYDSAGTAQWAKSVSGGSVGNSVFYAVSADKLGTLYAAGSQSNTVSYNYGSASVAGSGSLNAVLVKYNSAGTVQWASVSSGGEGGSGGGAYDDGNAQSLKTLQNTAMSAFTGVAVDKLGKVCVSGAQNNTGVYLYNGASAQGNFSAYNALIVKYNSSTGEAQWAQAPTSSGGTSIGTKSLFSLPGSEALAAVNDDAESTSNGSNASFFYGIAADGLGGFSTVGYQTGNGTFVYGNDISAQSDGTNNNAVMVEYK